MSRLLSILSLICFGCFISSADNNNLTFPDNLFTFQLDLDTQPHLKGPLSYIQFVGEGNIISPDTMSRYLIQISNNIEYIGTDCTKPIYKAKANLNINNTRFLVYEIKRPGNIIEAYLCPWTDKGNYPPTLLIYRSENAVVTTFCKIKEGKISIFYNYCGNRGLTPAVICDVYELNSTLTSIYSSFPPPTREPLQIEPMFK